MDDFRIYTTALTASEIAGIHSGFNPVAYSVTAQKGQPLTRLPDCRGLSIDQGTGAISGLTSKLGVHNVTVQRLTCPELQTEDSGSHRYSKQTHLSG